MENWRNNIKYRIFELHNRSLKYSSKTAMFSLLQFSRYFALNFKLATTGINTSKFHCCQSSLTLYTVISRSEKFLKLWVENYGVNYIVFTKLELKIQLYSYITSHFEIAHCSFRLQMSLNKLSLKYWVSFVVTAETIF